MYYKLVNYPNNELDRAIEDDETNKRFSVTLSSGKKLSMDPKKLVRVVRAYGIFDPPVFYKQAYVFMIPVLFHYLYEEEDVFYGLCRIMITLGWREHFIEPYPRQEKIVIEIQNIITFSMPKLFGKFKEDGELMLRMAIETLYDYVF